MEQVPIYEGTLDEIIRWYGKELSGRHLKVFVDDAAVHIKAEAKPFYETATPDEWEEALRTWTANHDRNTPLLSDEALDRENIYAGRGE